jgi:hypothetical protein
MGLHGLLILVLHVGSLLLLPFQSQQEQEYYLKSGQVHLSLSHFIVQLPFYAKYN